MTLQELVNKDLKKAEINLQKAKVKPNIPIAELEHCEELYRLRAMLAEIILNGGEMIILLKLIAKGWSKQSEGEWIDKPTGAYSRMQSWCSACGKHSGIGGIESNRHKPYCPNCGARMKGGAE